MNGTAKTHNELVHWRMKNRGIGMVEIEPGKEFSPDPALHHSP